MPTQTFGKNERLNSRKLIERLFNEGHSFFEFPFRVVMLQLDDSELYSGMNTCQVLTSVSKRNFRNAVSRNRIKRLMRESYRKNKTPLIGHLVFHHKKLALGLIYTGKKMPVYHHMESKINRIIDRLIQEIKSENNS